jgi:hypothetical protein
VLTIQIGSQRHNALIISSQLVISGGNGTIVLESGKRILDQVSELVVAFIRYQHLRSVNFFDECWRFSAVIDVTACHGECLWQAVSIHRQMHLGGVASPAFTDAFIVTAGGSSAVLVRFYIAAIIEDPFQIGVYFQHVEELSPEAFFRPVIEDFVDRIPFTEMLWQISPGHTGPHFVQNAFDCFAQTHLVIQTELKQYFP